MEKIIERNVPIAEENVTLSGQPATNMFEDWKKDKRDKEKIRNDDQTGTGSLRDICCCGVQVAERTGNANTGQSYHPGRSVGC